MQDTGTWLVPRLYPFWGPFLITYNRLFWQDAIGLFNTKNPSGNVVNSVWNMRILTIAISVSAAVAVKRFLVGLYMARQTYGKIKFDETLETMLPR